MDLEEIKLETNNIQLQTENAKLQRQIKLLKKEIFSFCDELNLLPIDTRFELKLNNKLKLSDFNKIELCKTGNNFFKYLRKCIKKDSKKDKKLKEIWDLIYGVMLGGSIQKHLALKSHYNGDIIILALMPNNNTKIKELYKLNTIFLRYVNRVIRRKAKKSKYFERYRVPNKPSKIITFYWNNIEFDLILSYTYTKINSLQFDTINYDECIRLFTNQELNKELELDFRYEREQYMIKMNELFRNTNTNNSNTNLQRFMKRNQNWNLSILSVIMTRRFINNDNSRLALLFLKVWRDYIIKTNKYGSFNNKLKSFLLETLVAIVCNNSIINNSVLNIINSVFDILILIGTQVSNEIFVFYRWPINANIFKSLHTKRDYYEMKMKAINESDDVYIADPITEQNIARKFNEWIKLKECCLKWKSKMFSNPILSFNEIMEFNKSNVNTSFVLSELELIDTDLEHYSTGDQKEDGIITNNESTDTNYSYSGSFVPSMSFEINKINSINILSDQTSNDSNNENIITINTDISIESLNINIVKTNNCIYSVILLILFDIRNENKNGYNIKRIYNYWKLNKKGLQFRHNVKFNKEFLKNINKDGGFIEFNRVCNLKSCVQRSDNKNGLIQRIVNKNRRIKYKLFSDVSKKEIFVILQKYLEVEVSSHKLSLNSFLISHEKKYSQI